MPLSSTPYDVPAENQSFLGSQGMQQAPTDNNAAMGLQRDPVSGRWTYHSTLPETLTAQELGSMPFGELKGQIYADTQQQYRDYINANLAKQAEGLNIAEESKRMTEDALTGLGDRARRNLDASRQQQLSRIDPRLSGTTISANQTSAIHRDYDQRGVDLEQQVSEARVGLMRNEYRNIQNLITGRTDTGPDMAGLNKMMLNSGISGLGSSGPDGADWWTGPVGGAVLRWATTPQQPGAQSPFGQGLGMLFGGGNNTGTAIGGAGLQGPVQQVAGVAGLGTTLSGVGTSAMGVATAAAPYVLPAAAAYAAYELYTRNRQDIEREADRIVEDVGDELKRGKKKVKKFLKKVEDWF